VVRLERNSIAVEETLNLFGGKFPISNVSGETGTTAF